MLSSYLLYAIFITKTFLIYRKFLFLPSKFDFLSLFTVISIAFSDEYICRDAKNLFFRMFSIAESCRIFCFISGTFFAFFFSKTIIICYFPQLFFKQLFHFIFRLLILLYKLPSQLRPSIRIESTKKKGDLI